jgi:hypothetical protein
MRQFNLTKEGKITKVLDYTAAGTDDTIESSVIDMQGFDAVVFVVAIGAITATGTAAVQVQQGDESDGSDMANLTGAAVNFAAADTTLLAAIEVVKPAKRYLQVNVTRATANVVINSAIAIQHGSAVKPVTNGATVKGTVCVATPAEAA